MRERLCTLVQLLVQMGYYNILRNKHIFPVVKLFQRTRYPFEFDQALPVNKKTVTITDIADRANVSKSTVSRVINNTTPVNEEKREAVLEAMKQLNYEPNIFAQGLASGYSRTIGVMTQNIGSPFYDTISQGVLEHLNHTNYSPIFADGRWREETGMAAAETLLGRMVDGLIIVGSAIPEEELESLKSRVPTLLVGRQVEGWDNQCLFIDNEQAGFEATKHLIDLGHRRVAHISGIKDHQDSIRRCEGYLRALTESGIESDPDLICEGSFDGDSGVAAVDRLVSREVKFSAIFAANDMTAFGARLALYRRGIRVPEEVSIIGFDDQLETEFSTPPMTTVHQPAMEMGIAAAETLLKMIAREDYELPELKTRIVVRESTSVWNKNS